jgi:L-threonylcarbamoyladenylate synthase
MKTVITGSIAAASRFILRGEVAAFPTETVYGLGADAFNDSAVLKIFRAKGRPADNPLIVHVASKKDISVLAEEIPLYANKLIDGFFPGPLTLILRKNEIISDIVTAGLDTIAVRMPSSIVARRFIKKCGVPIAAPSANISGSPSPTDAEHVIADFEGKISCILKGPKARYGLESTVVDCTGKHPVILRPGVVTIEELRRIDKLTKVRRNSLIIKSPGQKYRHYAPKGNVKIQNPNVKSKRAEPIKQKEAYIGLNKRYSKRFETIKICRSVEEYAKNIFSFFRECDKIGIKTIYCESIPEKGIGMAIMNRLKKAARKP